MSDDGREPDATRLAHAFFAHSADIVAPRLLGSRLLVLTDDGLAAGRIVEVEAYRGRDDPASHAARLRHGRVESMWGPPGVAYVYRSYGIHAMLNVVAHEAGAAGAVLIRALEPIRGLELMRRRRSVGPDHRLCAGPGRLCQAMGVTLDDHGTDLIAGAHIWLADGPSPSRIGRSDRIGISRGRDALWRFFDIDSPSVSVHRRSTT